MAGFEHEDVETKIDSYDEIIMNSTQEQLRLKFQQALSTAFGAEYAGVDPILVSASNPKFGDYQSNVALSLAKQLGQQPRAIAEQIVAKLLAVRRYHLPPV